MPITDRLLPAQSGHVHAGSLLEVEGFGVCSAGIRGHANRSCGPNEKGKPPPAAPSIRTIPERNRRGVFNIAEMEVSMNINGKPETRTLYEANVIRLGIDGAAGKISSARAFVKSGWPRHRLPGGIVRRQRRSSGDGRTFLSRSEQARKTLVPGK